MTSIVMKELADHGIIYAFISALRKTSHILLGLARYAERNSLPQPITYYALDLEKRELERTLGEIDASEIGAHLLGKVATKGMCGTYDDGLRFLENGGLADVLPTLSGVSALRGCSPVSSGSSSSDDGSTSAVLSDMDRSPGSSPTTPLTPVEDAVDTMGEGKRERALHIMFLGSSIGNFPREEAASFLRSLPLRPGAGDTLLLGLDHDNEKHKIEEAYNDPKGYTRDFIMNGLKVAGRALGDDKLFDESKWEYVNRYDSVGAPFLSSLH